MQLLEIRKPEGDWLCPDCVEHLGTGLGARGVPGELAAEQSKP